MVARFQVAAPILPDKMPSNNKQREDRRDMAYADNDPRDVISYEGCIRLTQTDEEA